MDTKVYNGKVKITDLSVTENLNAPLKTINNESLLGSGNITIKEPICATNADIDALFN